MQKALLSVLVTECDIISSGVKLKISPGSTSRITEPPITSIAALSEATTYPSSICPTQRGFIPKGSLNAYISSLCSRTIE